MVHPHSSMTVAVHTPAVETHFFAATRASCNALESATQSVDGASAVFVASASALASFMPASVSGAVDQSKLHPNRQETTSQRIVRGPYHDRVTAPMSPRAWSVALVVMALPCVARADDIEEARRAYDRGASAFERGDFRDAATAFIEADEKVPSTTALRAALDAVVELDDAVLGETLIERAATRPHDDALETAVRNARVRFAGKTGRIRIDCPTDCLATIDGSVAKVGSPIVVVVGSHEVKVDGDGVVRVQSVRVEPDRATSVALRRPQATGLSPAWFVTGTALTVASGVITSIFAADTIAQHDRFLADGCLHSPACNKAAVDGQNAQTRTNVALGTTIVLAAVTVTLLVFTRFKAPEVALRVASRALSGQITFE
jgi:hypothetical protein